jgi:hypothetical protein
MAYSSTSTVLLCTVEDGETHIRANGLQAVEKVVG